MNEELVSKIQRDSSITDSVSTALFHTAMCFAKSVRLLKTDQVEKDLHPRYSIKIVLEYVQKMLRKAIVCGRASNLTRIVTTTWTNDYQNLSCRLCSNCLRPTRVEMDRGLWGVCEWDIYQVERLE